MTHHNLSPFKLINKHTEQELTHKEIMKIAKDKGFFENEFRSYQVMLKDNGTPVIFGFNPLTSFSLNKDDYVLEWWY